MHTQALKNAEGLQAFLAAAADVLASLHEKAPALATSDETVDPATAADRRRKHEEAVAELAALGPKVKQVSTSGKKLVDADVRVCNCTCPAPPRPTARHPATDPRKDVLMACMPQHPEKATVEAKLAELDSVWTELNNQAKVLACANALRIATETKTMGSAMTTVPSPSGRRCRRRRTCRSTSACSRTWRSGSRRSRPLWRPTTSARTSALCRSGIKGVGTERRGDWPGETAARLGAEYVRRFVFSPHVLPPNRNCSRSSRRSRRTSVAASPVCRRRSPLPTT